MLTRKWLFSRLPIVFAVRACVACVRACACRTGCINNRQLTFLKRYKPSKKFPKPGGADGDCVVM
jgi:hypothetical protein